MPNSFSSSDPATQSEPSQGTFSGESPTDKDQSQQETPVSVNNSHQSDVDKINKRLNDKDEFINKLKSETAEYRQSIDTLREELSKRPSLDEIMEHINQQTGSNPTTIDPDDLINRAVEATENRMSQKQVQQKTQDNIKSVSDILNKAFQGEDLDQKVATIAAENDMTFDEVFELAARNPKAALKILGIKTEPRTGSTDSTGSINTAGFYQNTDRSKAPEGNILDKRNDRDRVDFFRKKMEEGLKQINR